MKATIEVTSRKEGDRLRAGLEDPAVRAFVQIIAELKRLPTDRARLRVLQFVSESLADERDAEKPLNLVTGTGG